MSVSVITAVFRHSASKGSARLVLLALADVAADSGDVTAYARGQAVLARKANVDAGTVRRAIDSLVSLGEVERLVVGDGRRSSDYRIILPGVGDDPLQGAPPAPARRAPTPGETHPQGVQDAAPITPSSTVDAPSPSDTSREPSPLAGFAEFWTAYPRKVAKPVAQKSWIRALDVGRDAGEIMAGLERWARYWTSRDDPEFIPHPATWLNQHRWLDDPPPVKVQAGPRGPVLADRSAPTGRVVDL